VLFRNEERSMRAKLIAHDIVECVLGLGPNLFYNSPMEACVVICRVRKPQNRKNKILFINAVNEVTRERAQSFLTDDHIQRMVAGYRNFDDVDEFARVAGTAEIRERDSNLSSALYVRPNNGRPNHKVAEGQTPYGDNSLEKTIVEWQQSSAKLRKSMGELFNELKDSTFV
jgi:type I restriction enzyme M protein